jgi:hypothetical protein
MITALYISKVIGTFVLVVSITKIFKWLYNYTALAIRVNRIPSPLTMIPLLGNAHQLESGSGILI